MKTTTKVKIVQFGLVAMGVFLLVIGLGHIFFPELSHQIVGQRAFDPTHPYMGLAARELGILFSVFGIAALIAALNPLRYKWLVFIVVLSSVLSDLNRASAVGCERLWIVTVISIILWLLIVIFYPYKRSGS